MESLILKSSSSEEQEIRQSSIRPKLLGSVGFALSLLMMLPCVVTNVAVLTLYTSCCCFCIIAIVVALWLLFFHCCCCIGPALILMHYCTVVAVLQLLYCHSYIVA